MKKLILVLLISTYSVFASAESISYVGFECANEHNTQKTANLIFSKIQVTSSNPGGMFTVAVTGGLPRVAHDGVSSCIDAVNSLGHEQNPTNISIFNKVVEPIREYKANGIAWYDSDDNVVVSVPSIRYVSKAHVDGNDNVTNSVFMPVNTMLVFQIQNTGAFKLLEYIRSTGGIGSVSSIHNGSLLYKDVIIDEVFDFTPVMSIYYAY